MARKYESAVLLTGDATGAVKAIDLTDDHLRQLNARQQRNQKTTRNQGQSWEQFSGTLKGAAAAMGLSVAGLTALGQRQLNAVAETDRLAKSIGVQTSQLQAMQYAAQFVGIEHDKMGDILKDVSDKIGDAYANGGGEAIDVINNLGLSAEKLVQMDPAEQIMTIGSALGQLQSQSERVTAMEAISDNATRLLPLLEDNSAEMRRLMQEGRDLNVAMSDSDIESFVGANNAIETMTSTVDGLTNSLLIELAPAITQSVEDIQAWVDEMGGMEVVVDRISNAFSVAIDVAEVLFSVWLGRKAFEVIDKNKGLFRSLGTAGSAAMVAMQRDSVGLNRALVITQGRIAATAAAGRALSGAMGLLGGPAGTAIVAAGAIYTFREELGLVPTEARSATEILSDLQGRIEGVTRASIDSEVAGFTAELVRLQSQAGQARDAIDTLEKAKSQPTSYGQGQQADLSYGITRHQSELNELDSEIEARQRAVEQLLDMRRDLDNESSENPGEVSNTKELVETYDQQHQKLQQLRADRAELQQLVKDDPEHADQYRRMLEENAQQIEKATESTKDNSAAKKAAKEAEREHERALEESASAYADLFAELSPVGNAQAEYQSTLAQLQLQVEEGTKSELEYYAAVGMAAQVYNQAAKAADPYHQRLDELESTYGGSQAKARQLSSDIDFLRQAIERTGDPTGRLTEQLHNAQDEMRGVGGESEAMAELWENSLDRMDDAAVDMWRSFLDGSEDAFSSFKNLALDTLAEVIHAYTTRQITASLGASLSVAGSGSAAAGQAGGMGSTGSISDLASVGSSLYGGGMQTAGNAYRAFAGTGSTYGGQFGSSLAASSGGGATQGFQSFAGSGIGNAALGIGGGLAGGYLGNEVFGGGEYSGIGATLGGVAGQALIPIPGVGAAVGSFLGSGIGSLFGGSGVDPNTIFKTEGEYGSSGRDGFEREIYADSSLGRVGFARESQDLDYAFDSFDEAQQFIDQVAQLDNAFAQAAGSDSGLAKMQEAVQNQGLLDRSGDEFLEQRYRTAFDTLDSRFEDLVMGINGDAQGFVQAAVAVSQVEPMLDEFSSAVQNEVVSRITGGAEQIVQSAGEMQTALQSLAVLDGSVDRLNLRFDETSAAAVTAASDLQQLMGGVDSLASAQQSYYDAFYSEDEKLANLEDDLQERFGELDLSMPDTAEGFRDLVEAQNLMTEAGREQYAALLNLVPTMSDYISVTEQAADALEQQMSRLQGWIDSLLLSDQSTLDPGERFQEAQSQYASVLVRAEEGDLDAIGNLGSVADQFLQEAASYYGQASGQYGDLFEEILADARGIDGSHADGLASVPFDGYRAELHAAETVLPASIAQLYRDSAPGSSTNREMLAELQALRRESQQLREEVRQLRGERSQDAARAAGQRADQLREQQRINRNTKTRPTTV
ncbi:hypothetical protein KZO83_07705 [Chromohalobacter sp. TMW 2.2308]|uniref:Bacteriophage tail tape measure N-terminal domain-containing protein n=1 Tax=Chromohalobacter moromii TaxID=2860329 RepID=A0A9X2X3N5_9GAMM|nr:hypothetical protein [Chromohalobacter moromii]MCK2042572.1 hypothetical protein [Chromohalobacter moromii]MCT8506131.1 hypothetical protein [Chromohalobacter moromii]